MERADSTHLQPWQQLAFSVAWTVPVAFTRDAFDPANLLLRDLLALREPGRRQRVLVFADTGVLAAMPQLPAMLASYAAAHCACIELAGPIVAVAGGEQCKNDPAVLAGLLDGLSERAIDRHAFVLAIGGGAVLDAVGYAAAIFHRGVRHIRFPTTVLAQADSGVGVKNAVNWHGQKNLLGTFSPAWGIVNDAAFIDLLPPREQRAGMAEAVKVALIRDGAFFDAIEEGAPALACFEPAAMASLIARSAALHMHQIGHGGDPFEQGSARPLDYGHWAAHKLERMSAHALSHGEAVAIGVALDTRYSTLAGLLPAGSDDRVHRLLTVLGFRLWHPQLLAPGVNGALALLDGLEDFRAHLGGELTITLLAAIGRGVEVHAIDSALVASAVAWLHARSGDRDGEGACN